MKRREFLLMSAGAGGALAAGSGQAAGADPSANSVPAESESPTGHDGILAQEDNDTNNETAQNDENDVADDEVVVELGNYFYRERDTGQNLADNPLIIEPGTTVRFVWITDNHDIILESQPEDSDWEGVPNTHDTGFEHVHTFTVEGLYDFFCSPHIGLGMIGEIEVTDDPPQPVPVGPQIPEAAMSLGIATAFALVATLGFAYVFLKYGGEAVEDG